MPMRTIKAINDAIDKHATSLSVTGAGTSILGWLAASDVAVATGTAMAIGGFLVNAVFKCREDMRQQREHELRVRELERELSESAGEE